MTMTMTSPLAILGGTPLAPDLAKRVPAWPPVDEETGQKLLEMYRSGKWSFSGPNEVAFEQEFAAFHDAKNGVFMANGSVTLECALAALGVGRGDEVIVPAVTWIATASAVQHIGAIPVFVDVQPDTICIDPKAIDSAITPRTKAIVPVHLYGSTSDMDAIMAIAAKHNLFVVEDCAHAHGTKWRGKGIGSIGHVGSFSFQQSKTMSGGEGGICITSDAVLAERLFRQKHIGYPPNSVQGVARTGPPAGLQCHNYRGVEFASVVLRPQLATLAERIAKYNANAERLTKRIESLGGRVQARGRHANPQGYYGFVMQFHTGPLADVPIDQLRKAITAEGLTVGGTYGIVPKHSLFNMADGEYRMTDCPVAFGPAVQRCCLFFHQALGAGDTEIDTIGDIIEKVTASAAQLREAQV
jgi:L-glutamine:2-deoxy-scyllo-inosose/3-amino-2,3-dideoxy-scyllo-inosose aminotransferase